LRKIIATLSAVITLLSIVPLVTPGTSSLTASASVASMCDVSASSITDFGQLNPGATSSIRTTSVSQPNGNIDGGLTIYGQDWNFGGSPTMSVGATQWRTGSDTFASLLISPGVSVGTLSHTTPTSVDLQVVVPAHQTAAAYTQTITFQVTC